MANDTENKGTHLPIPILVNVALIVLGIIAPNLPTLESARPAATDPAGFFWRDIEDVDARLWQDPFAAARVHPADGTREEGVPPESEAEPVPCARRFNVHHKFEGLVACIRERLARTHQQLLILGVMVSGGPYAEDGESRMRTRYAVLSGLSVAHYFPEDAKHIGYFNFESSSPDSAKLPEMIPFEWFVPDGGPSQAPDAPTILLLWLDESAFVGAPLARVGSLEKNFTQQLQGENDEQQSGGPGSQNPVRFRFIGPLGSDTLKAIAEELTGPQTSGSNAKLLAGQFLNASATADPDSFFPDDSGRSKSAADHLPLRTTLTDAQLAKGIVDELRLRGIHLGCESERDFMDCHKGQRADHIALISEWDTFYGRQGLPIAMENALGKKSAVERCRRWKLAEDCEKLPWIEKFSYMRGLDGIIPADDTSPAARGGEPKSDAPDRKAVVERPEGRSQKDYLRRLGDRIASFNEVMKERGEGEIRAIGVLGSDAYDKLLILKALRARFPGTLFFTTDLDSRLMHPKEVEAARNLLVASSFGLQLHRELQGAIPPFRDSTQTSYFLATQLSLCSDQKPALLKNLCPPHAPRDESHVEAQERMDQQLAPPRLFELGLSRPVPQGSGCPPIGGTCENLHRELGGHGGGWLTAALTGAAMLILGLLATLMSSSLHGVLTRLRAGLAASTHPVANAARLWQESPLAALLQVLLPAFLLAVAIFAGRAAIAHVAQQRGEPFAWAEGVSMWPTEIIRLLAVLFGVAFIAVASRQLKASRAAIDRRFFGGMECRKANRTSWRELLAAPWMQGRADGERGIEAGGGIQAEELWHWYCAGTAAPRRDCWVIVTSLTFFAFGLALMMAFDMPKVPFRGDDIYALDRIIIHSAALVYIVLVMLTFYVTQFNAEMITRLASHPSIWPEAALLKFGIRKPPQADSGLAGRKAIETLRSALIREKHYFLDELLDIRFIAEQTRAVGKIVYYPFIVLALLVFARSRVFDDWDRPLGLVAVILLSGGIALASTLRLRHAAEDARQKVLNQLGIMLRALSLIRDEPARILEQQTLLAIEEIRATREGAFRSFTQEPTVQALLLPFGSWGVQELFQYFVIAAS